ncbi:U3 small nucleolar RNA-associated protein 15 homolog [Chrysoperla carnea]|uniref:U3 small nucleolar RNA-associated protein 15 homolog n=1 Tax=Chrysoperla carnea TaxID=189513 RepID=UPI001D0987CB|nr:U3 small nucleolar RNA-associated protein 15 homolog [Chrysoperla carnea]
MSSFKKTNIKIFTKPTSVLTPDNVYWKKLSAPVLVKEFGPIDYIDFSPVEPHYFAVTCSVRVQIYNPITKLVTKNISRFRESAYGASFRSDGKLLCTGGEEKNVKLFDVNSKNLLRLFKGHTAPVHRTFFTSDKTHIASFSDDKSVRVWDIPTEKVINEYNEHKDYIRAGAVSPVSKDIILSGSYDNICKMYDGRTTDVVFSVDHNAPIESILFLPTGGIFLTAGGTEIRVWDAFMKGKLLARMSHHHKTITCLRLAQNGKRIMSSSLDRHVKIYDVATYNTVHTLDYPNGILSLGVSPNDESVVAGTVDGLVSISRRENEKEEVKSKKISYKFVSDTHPATVDVIVPTYNKDKLPEYDTHLRKFRFTKALDSVLKPYNINKKPETTVALMEELIRRKRLKAALTGRDSKSILQILRFLIKYITDYRFTRVLIDVANIFIDVFEESVHLQNAEIGKLFLRLTELVREDERLSEDLINLQGALSLLLAGASITDHVSNEQLETHNLTPSANAQQNLIINIS